MNRDQQIYEKINSAIRLLCDVYEILNTKEEIPEKKEKSLMGISSFSKKYPEFTQGKIRTYIFENTNNFNEKVTIRSGKRIYIKEKEFFDWIEGKI